MSAVLLEDNVKDLFKDKVL